MTNRRDEGAGRICFPSSEQIQNKPLEQHGNGCLVSIYLSIMQINCCPSLVSAKKQSSQSRYSLQFLWLMVSISYSVAANLIEGYIICIVVYVLLQYVFLGA